MIKPRTYVDWFEIARITRLRQQSRGRSFFDGVERAVALAAVNAPRDKESEINAAEYEFRRHEICSPRWDGSIA